ncbi:ATP-binding protein [Paraflavisolibacter sp. H34]|uniref:sensor histidine kinase n=1 Tax=Huijunlia imazamoxiresistens TaxID=3127457 RepID=UPI0030172D9A
MEQLPYDPQFFSELFDAQSQGLIWARPVFADGNGPPVDFQLVYCNKEGCKPFDLSRQELAGLCISNIPTLSGEVKGAVLQEMIRVYQTGEKSQTPIVNLRTNRRFLARFTRLRGGVFIEFGDITEETPAGNERDGLSVLADSILSASPNGILIARAVHDHAGRVVDFLIERVNPALPRMLSLSEEQFLQKSTVGIFPTELQTGVFEMLRRVFQTGTPSYMEVHYLEGRLDAWFQVSFVKLDDSLLAGFTDISPQKNATRTIEQQLSLLENILKRSSSGISVGAAIRDRQGRITDLGPLVVNEAAVKLTGIPKEVYLSQTLTQLVPQYWKSSYLQWCIRVLKTGKPRHAELFCEPTGKWLEISLFRIDPSQLIAILTDISSLKEAQLDLEHSVKELKRSNTSLEEFTYAASHDLHEPLRKIQYFSERLKKGLTTTPVAESIRMLERMVSAAAWMRRVIDDLLLYAKVSEKPHLQVKVRLNAVVQEVLHELKDPIHQTGTLVHVEQLPGIPGDPAQLRLLFQNLISNALKYRREDRTPEIWVRSKMVREGEATLRQFAAGGGGPYYLIEVADNGIGFEPEHAEKVFQIFQRLHGRQEYEGTGVGLAIVQKVVANHRGSVLANSELGKGASFQVLLPA